MKIYFAGSIRGGRDDVQLYLLLIEHFRTYGTVLTEHVGDDQLGLLGDDGPTDDQIYTRDMAWLTEADRVIAEVTNPRFGVGFEIGRIVERGDKPVLCLYRPQEGRRLSAMIAGCPNVTNVDSSKFSMNQ